MTTKSLLTIPAIFACFSLSAVGDVITPTGATSSLGNLANRPIEDAIDGSGLSSGGLSGDILSETHVIGSANDGPYFLGNKGSVLTFDLGTAKTVDAVHIWNYERASETDRGIKSFDMYFSTDGVNFGATPTVSITGVTQGDAVGGIPVQSFSFAEQSGFRYIRLDNIVNWGDASYTGLSEIRFGEVVTPYQSWLAANNLTASDANFMKFGFGIAPAASPGAASYSYTAGAPPTITVSAGYPTVSLATAPESVDFRLVFSRPSNWASLGLGYTVQFSADLTTWVDSININTLTIDGNPIVQSGVEMAYAPYPLFIEAAGEVVKPSYARVKINTTPSDPPVNP